MAIKAFYEKLMAISDGPSLMDHHRHVWLEHYVWNIQLDLFKAFAIVTNQSNLNVFVNTFLG